MDNNFYEEYSENGSQNEVSSKIDSITSVSSITFIKTYVWMFLGVLITFIVGLVAERIFTAALNANNSAIVNIYLAIFIVSFIVELILSFTLTKHARSELTVNKARIEFLVYSILTGITFSMLFCILDLAILYQIFAGVAIYFLILSVVSFLFRKSIDKVSRFAFVGLITLLISSLIVVAFSLIASNYIASSGLSLPLYLGISIFGLVVFTLLTIVDVKKVKESISANTDNPKGASIVGAFILYLDFINILIYVIRIVIVLGGGKSKK